MNFKNLAPLFASIVTLVVPLAILMLAVRLLLTPLFLNIEYRMPGFPADLYGFGLQDRLQWAKPSVEYLVNSAGIDTLAKLVFANGQPIYNQRELSHMSDVKTVVQNLLVLWYGDLILLIALGALAWHYGWWEGFVQAVRYGGLLTAGLLVALAAFASISFWKFFSWFHSLFFSGDSWLFEFTDTLIRLFPIRFWQDAVAYIGVFSIGIGLLLWFGLKPVAK